MEKDMDMNMKMNRTINGRIRGSWVALPTPFTEEGAVNLNRFKDLIDFHKAHHTDGLLVLGSAGEASMISRPEKEEIIEFVVDYAKNRIPVLVGTTGSNTADSLHLTSFAKDCGAFGALMLVPAYITPPQEAIYNFFAEIAAQVPIPIAVYNNPTRVGISISPETAVKLSHIKSIIALKQAIPHVNQLIEIKKAVRDTFDVLTCDSPLFSIILPNLAIGGSGTANITGNIAPEEFTHLSQPWKTLEDMERSRRLVLDNFDLMKMCYSVTNPVVIKAGLNLYGLDVGNPRPPLPALDETQKKNLKVLLNTKGLLDKYSV
ncbi:MAG: 4-hydroxy-tetrahydrodipicolinate synthase [Theionarchaea archaeon]|nr:4-hydroxy-tetrahydrodipicolinate synthase [Theionarchaea archaeon]